MANNKNLAIHALTLFGGNGINAVCQLVLTIYLASTLPDKEWGSIAVIITYVSICEILFATKNWLLTSSHAFSYFKAKKFSRFSATFSRFFVAEIVTNLLATLVALCLVPVFLHFAGLGPQYTTACSIYACSIIFRISGSPAAILRLLGKYSWQAIHASSMGVMRLVAVFTLAHFSRNPAYILLAIGLIESICHLALTSATFYHLSALGISIRNLLGNLPKHLFRQNWRLIATSHSTNMVKVGIREVDILFVSGFLGPETAGVVKVLKTILRSILLLSDPLGNAALSQMVLAAQPGASQSAPQNTVLFRLTLIGGFLATCGLGALYLAIALFWQKLSSVPLPLNNPYFYLYGAGIWISVTFFALPSANIARKGYTTALIVTLASSAIYLVAMSFFIPFFGIIGAGSAFLVFQIVWAFLYLYSFSPLYDKHRQHA